MFEEEDRFILNPRMSSASGLTITSELITIMALHTHRQKIEFRDERTKTDSLH